jgi:hypothetical protein
MVCTSGTIICSVFSGQKYRRPPWFLLFLIPHPIHRYRHVPYF